VHGGVQVVGGRGQQIDGFADVPPSGRYADAEPGGQSGVGVAVAQVGKREQRLPSRVEAPPPRRRWVRCWRMMLARWFSVRVDSGIAAG
jgi:hypothetical protein